MAKIATKAGVLDTALRGLDDRLGVLDRSQDDLATNWERRSNRMSSAFTDDINKMRRQMTTLSAYLSTFDRKKTIRVDADTSRALAKVRGLHALASKNATMGINSRGGMGSRILGGVGVGGLAGGLGAMAEKRSGSILGRGLTTAAHGADALGTSLDRIGVNIGPISTRLSTLPPLVAVLGGPLMGAAAAGVSVLAGSLSALAAGGVGAVSMLGAFTVGIGSIAIPALIAGKRISEANKELVKAKEAVAKAKPGTKSYENAVRRLTAAKKALSKSDQELIKNSSALKKAWDKQIMQGKSGQRVVRMMNEAVLFGAKQMPWVASMFDKFTLSGERLFRMANKEAPRFRNLLTRATDEWPARFEDGAIATGHFAEGLLEVVDAAEPFTKWMSEGLVKNMREFNEWAGSKGGKNSIAGWLKDMQPVLQALGRLGGQTGKSIINLSRRDADDVVYFIDELTTGMRKLPGLIDKWSDRFRDTWPTVRGFFGDLEDFIDYTWRGFQDIEGALDGPLKKMGDLLGIVKDLASEMPEWMGVLLMSGLATKGGRGLLARGFGGGKGPKGTATDPLFVVVENGGVPGVVPGARPGPAPVPGPWWKAPWARTAGWMAAVYGGYKTVEKINEYGQQGAYSPNGGGVEVARQRSADKIAEAFRPMLEMFGDAVAARIKRQYNVALARAAGVTDPKVLEGIASGSVPVTVKPKKNPVRDFMKPFDSAAPVQNGSLGSAFAFAQDDSHWINRMRKAAKAAMDAGRSEVNIGGAKIVLAYNRKIGEIEMRRIDLSGFFADMWAKFREGVGALGGIVESVTGPLNSFWSALTGSGAAPSAPTGASGGTPGDPKPAARKPLASGDSRKGAGVMGRATGAIKGALSAGSGILGAGANLASRAINWLRDKGTAGNRTADGIQTMQSALTERLSSMFSSGGAASASGLLPQAQSLMAMLSSMFGVKLTSGFREGAITESGNMSLHGLGRAIDVGGTAAQMQAVWNYLLGKQGIDEMIYAGQIAENGGAPRPYGGSDKHYDHVHIGIGDSKRGSGIPASGNGKPVAGGGVTVSLAGATIHIHNESDYEAFVERLADDIDRAVNSTGLSAEGMLDA